MATSCDMLAQARPMPKKSAPPLQVQINLRIPDSLLASVDARLEKENQRRSWPKLTRSDLIRTLLENWAAGDGPVKPGG